jgi:subtilisin family serine protease
MVRFGRILTATAVAVCALAAAGTAAAERYVVVLKPSEQGAGLAAIERSGGTVVGVDKLGIATVTSSKSSFARVLHASRAVSGVARDAWFGSHRPAPTRFTARASAVETVPAIRAACASVYEVPALIGPDPLGACQWDMRAIGVSGAGSYGVNRGAGAVIGVIDTGVDLAHPDLAPNLDVARSCSFIYATTPTSEPSERVPRGDCSNKTAVQDLNGHGTHTAGTIAAPINGVGISGVAPAAKLVALKAGTAQAYFFTDSIVDALTYAGDQRLDAVNMSFFADPWLFNCRSDAEQRTIVQAITRAAKYAQQRGVVLVASAGNDGIDWSHPTTDEISPTDPSGVAVTRTVNNSCVVLPTEIPGVILATATGAQNLLAFYSSYGNLVDVTAPGGSFFQGPDFILGTVLSTYSSTAQNLGGLIAGAAPRLVQEANGAYYLWDLGTSMAAPHVTGVVALIRSAHPGMSVGAVAAMVRRTATPLACPAEPDPGGEIFGTPPQFCSGGVGSNNFYGKGLINALLAAKA